MPPHLRRATTIGVQILTSDFFESLGRLAFEFAAVEEMLGLCIWQLNSSEDVKAIWQDSFQGKLKRFKKEATAAGCAKRIDTSVVRLK